MGRTIASVVDMVSYAGDLRRAAKQAPAETAEKIQRSAQELEKTALARIGQAGPGIGLLLDKLV
jgi:hypothetical protein